MPRPFLTSLTRIAPFERRCVSSRALPREAWRTGDYVLARVLAAGGALRPIESRDGREVRVAPEDLIVGALGRRHATLEAVGRWEAVGPDLRLQALTAAGVLGRCTSRSWSIAPLLELAYEGHALIDGEPANMADFAIEPEPRPLTAPVVLLIGTSMDAGKTVSGSAVVRRLKRLGLRVGAAKLTGVGRLRDILELGDAGADVVLDFVDAGLPSTACSRERFEPALSRILAAIAAQRVDVLVAEAGASPLEPYNGAAAFERLRPALACVVLCASDPYSVVGVMGAFDVEPDLLAGRATSTSAGIELCERLAGVKALNLIDPGSLPELDALLEQLVLRRPIRT